MEQSKFHFWLIRAAFVAAVFLGAADTAQAGRFIEAPDQNENRPVRSSSTAGHFGNPTFGGYNRNPYEAEYLSYLKAEANYKKQLAQYNYKIRLIRHKEEARQQVVREKHYQQMMARWEKDYQMRMEMQARQPQPSSNHWSGSENTPSTPEKVVVRNRRGGAEMMRSASAAAPSGSSKPSIWERLKAAFSGRMR